MFPSRNKPRHRGFTLLEMLVVIFVIVALAAILIPSLNKARISAQRASAVTELHTIRSGLQMYYADFNMYPSSSPADSPRIPNSGLPFLGTNTYMGPEMLAQGLMGYMAYGLDGAGSGSPGAAGGNPDPQFGFRVRPAAMGGKIYGPYLSPDANNYVRQLAGSDEYFIDPWGPRVAPVAPNGSPSPRAGALLAHKILYFRSSRSLPGTSVSTATTIFGDSNSTTSLFNYTDCTPDLPTDLSQAKMTQQFNPGENSGLAKAQASRYDFMRMLNASAPPAPDFTKSYDVAAINTQLNTINGPVPGATNFLLISAGQDGKPAQGFQNKYPSPWTGYFDRDDIIMTDDK